MSFVSSNTLSPYPSKLSNSSSWRLEGKSDNSVAKEVKLSYTKKSTSSLADKLCGHFDQDWKTNKSVLREESLRHKTYHPAHSWEARSDNPQAFSKLQCENLPVQPSCPMTLSGAQVLLLEHQRDMSVFNNGIPVPASAAKYLPLNSKQQDIGMTPSIVNAKIPIQEAARANGSHVVIPKDSAFDTYLVRAPEFKLQKTPLCLENAGTNADQALLNPAQRREIMIFERESQRGSKYVKDALYQRLKLHAALKGPVYHRGVLMYDTCDNIDSEIYHDKAAFIQHEDDKKVRNREIRANNIVEKSVHLNRNFGDLVNQSAKQEPLFVSKGGVHASLGLQETKARLFERESSYDVNPLRLQALRDQETRGRHYNILNHTQIQNPY